MKNTTSKKIRILKGSVLIAGQSYTPGKVVEVGDDLHAFLVRKRSNAMQFVTVEEEGEILPPSGPGPSELEGQDNGGGEEGPESGNLTNGEGEELHDLQPSTTSPEVVAPVASAPVAPGGLTLKAVDAPILAALAAAGFGTVEALKAATVPELVAVRGIGKSRALAILQEVAEL